MHIPKTAGTSLYLLLRKNVNPEEILAIYGNESKFDEFNDCATLEDVENFPEKYKHKKYFIGHFVYGLHTKLSIPNDECSYITFLRNPVDLAISTHNQWYRHLNLSDRPDIRHFINSTFEPNIMKRYISGNTTLENAFKYINTHFIHIGLVESYRQSIKNLCIKLDWKDNTEIISNISDVSIKNTLVIDEILTSTIKKISSDDQILYNYYHSHMKLLNY